MVLLAGNISKYKFLAGEDIYEYNSAFFDTKYDCLIWFYCVWQISITFMDENGRLLEIENIVWHYLSINGNSMLPERTKNKKICQRIWIFVICEKSITQIWEKIIALFTAIIVIREDNTAKAGLDALKTFKNSSS